MKGDLANNSEFFKESWANFKIATYLDMKNEKLEEQHYYQQLGKKHCKYMATYQ